MPMEVDVVNERLELLAAIKDARTKALISEELHDAIRDKALAEIEAEVTE